MSVNKQREVTNIKILLSLISKFLMDFPLLVSHEELHILSISCVYS